jgi:predicted  nucleic acid-binding Zn-ribbon protein
MVGIKRGKHRMTDKQTNYTIFIIAVITGLILLSTIQKVDDQLERSRLAVVDMQKQIDKLKAEDEELKHLVVKLTNANLSLNKDLDVTQELQRKQAQAIVDLRKGKKR